MTKKKAISKHPARTAKTITIAILTAIATAIIALCTHKLT